MSLTVILVAYYGDKWLPDCVDTLNTSSVDRIRLLLVDNAGNTILEKLNLSRFDTKIIQCEKPLGFAEANNFALVNGGLETDFICFLNQDTLSSKNWLDTIIQCLSSNEEIGAIIPLVLTYDWQDLDPNFLECAYLSAEFRDNWDRKSKIKEWYSVLRIPAVAMVIRTEVIKKVGPFDPIYHSYYEDYDLCMRIQNAGYKTAICTRGQIAHYSSSVTIDEAKEKNRMRQIIRNKAIMDVRFSENRNLSFLMNMFYYFPRRLARALINTPSSQPLDTVLKAWNDFIALSPRLASKRFDRLAWEKYLYEIRWPEEYSHSKES